MSKCALHTAAHFTNKHTPLYENEQNERNIAMETTKSHQVVRLFHSNTNSNLNAGFNQSSQTQLTNAFSWTTLEMKN